MKYLLLVLALPVLCFLIWFGWIVYLDTTEPQDVLVHGLSENDTFLVDGSVIGTGRYVCLPQIKQGKHEFTLKGADKATILVADIGDVSIRILEPADFRGTDVVELSNCSDPKLIKSQTTTPSVERIELDPSDAFVPPYARE